jgi:hypothetical protein
MTAAVALASLAPRYTEMDLGSDYDDDDSESSSDRKETSLNAGHPIFDSTYPPDDDDLLSLLFDPVSGDGNELEIKSLAGGENLDGDESSESDTAKNRSHDAPADLSSSTNDTPVYKDEDVPAQAEPKVDGSETMVHLAGRG